jgi:salicylate hydroxylase
VLAAIGKQAVFPARLQWMDALTAKPITAVDLGEPFRRRYGQAYIVMHRGDLLAALLDACRAERLITLAPSSEIVAVEDRGDWARARLSDGAVLDAEILIGADGLHSMVRRSLSDDAPVCDGCVAFRGTIPMAQLSRHAGLDNVVMWVGPKMHFVQYPLRGGDLYNQVAVFQSPRYAPGVEEWGTVEELDAHYAQTCDYVRECVKLMWRDRRWPMFDRKPIARWTLNRIALLGDAAHPMYQYIAQGACQAIEDGLALARHLGAASADPAAALRAYEAARLLRTARVQLTARAMGAFFHLDGVGATLRNAMMGARRADDYTMLDWLYGHRV